MRMVVFLEPTDEGDQSSSWTWVTGVRAREHRTAEN